MASSLDESIDLKKQFHTTLALVRTISAFLTEMENVCKPHVDRISNLLEQYQCCADVDPLLLPRKVDFMDIKKKLLFKITQEINKEIDAVLVFVRKLGHYSDRLCRHFDHCMSRYRSSFSTMDTEIVTQASPKQPSITDILEMLDECCRGVRERFLCKQLLLTSLDSAHPRVGDSLGRDWGEGDRAVYSHLTECLTVCGDVLGS
ncbi:uncharacterized protein LOC128244815 [Mya arenaria]|uniref:uncharacterized protein LOC128244815 n=1 Tax=Mya arenaria TaxID=6604 RepID=UPI0022E1F5C2|nr:uncharacterized protein LOC128244815 [Mya arenaria]XP_052818862.1 uncharacterized protein LOC128244815 [Mya arenaria]XP_052818863.1 uncharacterized protein LOC128244815 [Mya arenaria]XP_052818865.1 uncharacterized protein LOC128244815 [Mya arenaria]XP_052818866.1 uncharacterized protein LOC128244815 [Mya arenaria]